MNGVPTVFIICAVTAIALPAQTLTTLVSFNGTNGANPVSELIQATDGNFYGTTAGNGNGIWGSVFELTPSGALSTLHTFSGNSDGADPFGRLLRTGNGEFYGTTYYGGVRPGEYGPGTIFKISPTGALTTLYSFCAQSTCLDGAGPPAGLAGGLDGDFYGVTAYGGQQNDGTIFEITRAGALTTLYNFTCSETCPNGQTPGSRLIRGTDGDLYGTTMAGGVSNKGAIFKIAPGTLTTLYSLCSQTGCTDGEYSRSGLLLANDANFYGTTYNGGTNQCFPGCGTIFKITAEGVFSTLYRFNGSDGANPQASLVQGTDGSLYGTTYIGGADNKGTVFRLNVGLEPPAE